MTFLQVLSFSPCLVPMFRVFIFGVFQTIYIYDDYFKYAADNRALKAEAPLHLLQYATLLASGRGCLGESAPCGKRAFTGVAAAGRSSYSEATSTSLPSTPERRWRRFPKEERSSSAFKSGVSPFDESGSRFNALAESLE